MIDKITIIVQAATLLIWSIADKKLVGVVCSSVIIGLTISRILLQKKE